MYVQLDRLEDGGRAVLFTYPEGGSEGTETINVPAEALPEEATPGDVFRVDFLKDEAETEKARRTNRDLMDELLDRKTNG